MPPSRNHLHARSPERQDELVRWLRIEGTLTYDQIQKRFGVAPMTARRDVAALHAQGKLIKVLRGAMRPNGEGLLTEGPLYLRQRKNLAAKQAIAQAALRLVRPGHTLYLDAGTTCIEFARAVADRQVPVTIVTSSVLVAACFCQCPAAKVVQMGGYLNPQNGCVGGGDAERAAADYFIDLGFFTTLGYVPGEGTYESSPETFRVKQAFVARCAEVVLLVDHSKFGQRALSRVFADKDINRIVTDRAVPGLKDARIIVAR